MDPQYPIGAPRPLVERVKAILLTPKTEWLAIDAEPATVQGIFKSYVVPLAAIGPVASLIGSLVFGWHFFGITYRPPIGAAIAGAAVSYALALASVFVLAFVIDALAPSFGGTKNQVQAFKVAAYGATASWVAGIFNLIPMLGWLGILGLYSLYLIYLGLPLLMRAPAEKALGYTVVTIISAAVIALVISALSAPIVRMFGGGPAGYASTADAGAVSGTVNIPGGGSLDLDKLNAASARASAQADAVKNGTAKAVDPMKLQALMPATLVGYGRTELSSSGAAAAGLGGAEAEATYQGNGGKQFTLKITDMAAAGALMALGSALNVQSNKQTATGYEKTSTEGGAMTSEKWDNSSNSGSYSTVANDRFAIEAEGTAGSIGDLKSAVASVNTGALGGAGGVRRGDGKWRLLVVSRRSASGPEAP